MKYIKVVFVHLGSKLSYVFIFNEVSWFFPSNVCLRESISRAISYTSWWDRHGWIFFAHVFFITLNYTVLSFLSILCSMQEKKQTCIFIGHSPFTRFFSFYFVFLPSMNQYFCSNDIIRIHHAFSLLVYIIFPFSSDHSLMFKFTYAHLYDRKDYKTVVFCY